MSISKRKVGLLHVAKQQLGLSEADYRQTLRDVAGVDSARDLDEDGFKRVLARFQALGFTSSIERRNYGHRAGMATPEQLEYIRGLWRQYTSGHDSGLEHWIEHDFGVSALRFLDRPTAGKVLTALKAMAARNAGSARPTS